LVQRHRAEAGGVAVIADERVVAWFAAPRSSATHEVEVAAEYEVYPAAAPSADRVAHQRGRELPVAADDPDVRGLRIGQRTLGDAHVVVGLRVVVRLSHDAHARTHSAERPAISA